MTQREARLARGFSHLVWRDRFLREEWSNRQIRRILVFSRLRWNGDMERPKSAVEIFGSVRFAEENDMFHVPKYLADVFRAFARGHNNRQ